MNLRRTIVAGLAATRLVRAWKYEEVGEKPREALLGWLDKPVMRRDPFVRGASDQVSVRATMVKQWAHELFDCPHCFGFWLTLACSSLQRDRRARVLIEALAGSMILSSIVQWYPGFDFEEPDPPDPVEVNLHQDGKPK